MTEITTPSAVLGDARPGVAGWPRGKDPGLLVTKRCLRGATLLTATFAIAHEFFSSGQVGLLAAFGSFSVLFMVEFTGPLRRRAVSFLTLFAVSIPLIALGTALSTHKVAAVIGMAVVGFLVLFSGVVAPPVAAATTAVLLNFVLPLAVVQPSSAIGDRLLGWALAGAICIPACLFWWPPPWHDDLLRRASDTADAVADLVGAWARHGTVDRARQRAVDDAFSRLHRQFSKTPYPPTGAAASAVALSKLVGRLEWVSSISSRLCDNQLLVSPRFAGEKAQAVAVLEAVSATLHAVAALICDTDAHPVSDRARIAAVEDAIGHLDALVHSELEADVASIAERDVGETPAGAEDPGDDVIPGRVLDPGYHVRGLGIAASLVADASLEAAGAEPVSEHDRRMPGRPRSPYVGRILSHLSFRSVWFRNAVRGAAGLTLAVVVIEVTDVQHGFWVALGAISVLRSNAAGTGASVLRAVGGTTVGVVIGSAIMIGVADHTVLLWVVLPLSVLVAGAAPSYNAFAVAQGGFTLMVIILFNILQPVGWKVGITRIEDIAIGCAVSLVVGLLFWPRGATAALGRALSDAYVAGSAYLAATVDRLTMTSQFVDVEPSEQESRRAYLLLDDAYRQFLTERGAKVVPVDTVAKLFMGSNRLRLGAYNLGMLRVDPPAEGRGEVEEVAVAEAVLRDGYAATHRWYQEFASVLADGRSHLALPEPHHETLHHVLRVAFDEVRSQGRTDRVPTALQMLWADELLEDQSTMQADLQASADLFSRKRHRALI